MLWWGLLIDPRPKLMWQFAFWLHSLKSNWHLTHLLNTTFWNFRVSRYLTDKTDLENGSLHLVMLWLASSKGGHADWGCWTGLCINSHSMMRITMILCWQHHNGESMLPCRSHKSMHTCSVKEICSSGDHYHCDRTKCDQGDDCFLSQTIKPESQLHRQPVLLMGMERSAVGRFFASDLFSRYVYGKRIIKVHTLEEDSSRHCG